MSSSRRSRVIALLCAFASGCGAAAGDEPAEDVADAPAEMNGHNSLSNYALGYSTLVANHRALAFLRSHSLGEAANAGAEYPDYPEMRYQLHQDLARESMRYIAECALRPEQAVSYADPFAGGPPHEFNGKHALCPEWQNNSPSQECLELVSACVLARVNAVGARVALSLRGERLPMDPARAPESRYKDGAPVASFESCPGWGYGLNRSCGFHPDNVGTCTPGTTVTVGAGASASGCTAPLGYSTGDTMLRICQGIYGCDPETPWSASSYAGMASTPEGYAAQNDDRCGLKPAVTFTCPSSGYYSVMAATYNAAAPQNDITDPAKFRVQASTGSLPASEAEVFTYVEGGFFGDIFDPENLAAEVDLQVGPDGQVYGNGNYMVPTIFKKAFACYSPRWNDGFAQLTSRMCAGPGANCLMQIAGACTDRFYGNEGDPLHRCATDNASGAGDYGDCLDREGAQRWRLPITTYLNDPCDTVTWPGSEAPASCQEAYVGIGLWGWHF